MSSGRERPGRPAGRLVATGRVTMRFNWRDPQPAGPTHQKPASQPPQSLLSRPWLYMTSHANTAHSLTHSLIVLAFIKTTRPSAAVAEGWAELSLPPPPPFITTAVCRGRPISATRDQRQSDKSLYKLSFTHNNSITICSSNNPP